MKGHFQSAKDVFGLSTDPLSKGRGCRGRDDQREIADPVATPNGDGH